MRPISFAMTLAFTIALTLVPPSDRAHVALAAECSVRTGPSIPPPANPPSAFAPYVDAHNCGGYDAWPYGLQKRNGYAARLGEEDLKKQLAARPTTYLLGELDTLPLYGFDSSCSAMAQGPTRVARGLAYAKHVNEKAGAQHKTVTVPACGHNARCVFTADQVLPLLFPKE